MASAIGFRVTQTAMDAIVESVGKSLPAANLWLRGPEKRKKYTSILFFFNSNFP
jgi:hypothetical protein